MNYYNEWDPQAAAWLRELIAERLIPRGLVDERSITEVKAEDLEGFTQCHFFAGIAGWPLALQLAGVSHKTRLWTGSPPCQPFSAAGKQLGQFDPRHLAPVFLSLVSECSPPVLFGEQVAPAIAKSWMCDLQAHLEGEDYAVGFAVLPACSVGAPHKRDRLFFGAHRRAHTSGITDNKRREHAQHRRQNETEQTGVGHTDDTRPQGRPALPQRADKQPAWASGMADSGPADQDYGFWSGADWLGCRDGKFRPVESSTFPLANGIPARVGRLRGYGNAIVPQLAAEFIAAYEEIRGNK